MSCNYGIGPTVVAGSYTLFNWPSEPGGKLRRSFQVIELPEPVDDLAEAVVELGRPLRRALLRPLHEDAIGLRTLELDEGIGATL